MAKCPKCKKEIEYLNKFIKIERKLKLMADGSEHTLEMYDVGEDDDYECPECNTSLFTDYDKALSFLKEK